MNYIYYNNTIITIIAYNLHAKVSNNRLTQLIWCHILCCNPWPALPLAETLTMDGLNLSFPTCVPFCAVIKVELWQRQISVKPKQ